MARRHTFLWHGMLSIAALHLAALKPADEERYQVLAAWHQNLALPDFRNALANPTESNCHAIVAFPQIFTIHFLASGQHDGDLLLVNDNSTNEPVLPDWLVFIRKSCTILKYVWTFIQNGPLVSLAQKLPIPDSEAMLLSPFAQRLQYLAHMPFRALDPADVDMPDASHPDALTHVHDNDQDMQAQGHDAADGASSPCRAALAHLSRLFALVDLLGSTGIPPNWSILYVWPAQVSNGYLKLLQARDPCALVLLAHYCILLKSLEPRWFLHGFAKNLFRRILRCLGQEWHVWLVWPLEELGE